MVMAVYAADRRSLRNFKGAATGQRRITVRVWVRDPDRWTDPETASKLHVLLKWLSEDEWSFHFDERKGGPRPSETEHFLFELPPALPVSVSLFSGGLDSIAGLAVRVQEEPSRSYVLVSGYTHNRLAFQQRFQVQCIKSVLRQGAAPEEIPELRHLAVPFGIRNPNGCQEEKSQRTRGLVFLALGVAAAVQAGTDTLWVHENGIGALNLPLSEAQLGVDNYRGVHPRSLMLAEDLFAAALRQQVRIKNPFLFQTKAEMCTGLRSGRLADIIKETVSCDGFPQRIRNQPPQCGYCTSCVLRRQSLHASGLEQYDPAVGYRYDVFRGQADLNQRYLFGLELMRGQIHKISQCLSCNTPWCTLAASFPELGRVQAELSAREGLRAEVVKDRFVRLYETYVGEWRSFVPAKLAA
ncbi:MAG: 7-cyano-7-deazaguanine synthase [Chloroflexi bacterium]|nr:7-cyano-7-deazaguanine synthase [Chloroflexota bacterium]MCY3937314.1 7-cyano-7-deazaguanine synthase [Chloroflexota bacterium]